MSSAPVEEDCCEREPVGSITVEFSPKSSCIKTIRIIWNVERLFTHNMSRGDSVNSPIFSSQPLCASTWRLIFFPKGNSTGPQLISSVCLENMSKDGNFLAEFTVTVIDVKNISSRNFSKVSKPVTFCGCKSSSQFITVGNLFHTKQCQIICEFTKCLDMDDMSPYPDSRICASQQKLCDDLTSFFATQAYSDVTLRVEDREIKAHRNILSARSPVFHCMFLSQMKENHYSIVEISDMSYESMFKFVAFLYSGKIDELSFEVAFELLAASHKYMIKDLHAVCSEFLSKSLTVQNCLDVLLLADIHSNAELKEIAMNCFCDNFKQVCDETMDFQSRLNDRPHLAVELISILGKKA